MSAPLFSLPWSAVLALALGVPFVVRSMTNQNPTPAVLFPAGAVELPIVEGQALFPFIEAIARGPWGERPLNTAELIHPMPRQYFFDLVIRHFGPGATSEQEVIVKRITAFKVPRQRPTPQQQVEVTEWLSRAMRKQHPAATALVLRIKGGRYDLESRRLAATEVHEEIIVPVR